ncbi:MULTISPECIES: DUF4097 family beta strand repeat-containing protein [Actinoplanes]|uniref:DUF4097 family beta strand repeat-containing protein n=1 Tax=Actinoplanes TaxID=1865 RepID=UPI0005F2C0A2|nr:MULTISPECIES: DUF4097 family beta strand repeat-containing protein [Actinoplanes]GLY00133.1 hypothetical protein Acsp01_05120 [Actinoplanes sp. NBRC 101535]
MYEFPRTSPVVVDLRVRHGMVAIDAGPHERVQVTVEPPAPDVEMTLDGDTLLIHDPRRRGPELAITVRVPADSAITGRSAAADVRATGRYATAHLDLGSADGWIEEITGDVHITAASGDVIVGRAGSAVWAKSSSGQVRVGDVVGDVTIDTASGAITVGAAHASLQARSASGAVSVGSLRQGQAKIRTTSGDVTVGVEAGTGVWLDLDTHAGHSVTDLTAGGGSAAAPSGAGLELRVRTSSGDIHVHRVDSIAMAA